MKRVLLLVAALFMVAACAYADVVAHWPFDEDTTEMISETAGSLEGDASINTSDAHLGDGCLEAGAGGYVDTGVDLNLTLPFTVAAWVQFEGDVVGSVVSDNHFDNPGGRLFGVDNDEIYTDIGWVAAHFGDAAGLNDGTWHHIAWTCDDDGTSVLYYDGDVSDAGSYDLNTAFGTDLEDAIWIAAGGFYEPVGFDFVGLVDDVQIYDEILDEAGIEEAMEGLGPPPPSNSARITGPHNVDVGADVTLTVVTDGYDEGTVTYLWNDASTGDSLALGVVDAGDTGVYTCAVNGDVGGEAVEEIEASFTLWVGVATPLTGGLGLGLLAGACALAGAVVIRRKK